MKIFSFRSLKAWFGYSRRERRASFILLILIIIVAGARYTVPQSDMEIKILPDDGLQQVSYTDLSPPVDTPDAGQGIRLKRTNSIRILELNSCDSTALESLPGIGPVLAARIIKYRNLLGGYAFTEQLLEVYGLTQETFEQIRPRVITDSGAVIRINVNVADFRQLIRFPYFERYEVNAILKYRELQGGINNINELFDNKLVADEKKRKVEAYMKVE